MLDFNQSIDDLLDLYWDMCDLYQDDRLTQEELDDLDCLEAHLDDQGVINRN